MEDFCDPNIPNSQRAFDHIVVELSGVAEPKSIRANFQEAAMYDMPLLERVRLDTMITVLDCETFLSHLKSGKVSLGQYLNIHCFIKKIGIWC